MMWKCFAANVNRRRASKNNTYSYKQKRIHLKRFLFSYSCYVSSTVQKYVLLNGHLIIIKLYLRQLLISRFKLWLYCLQFHLSSKNTHNFVSFQLITRKIEKKTLQQFVSLLCGFFNLICIGIYINSEKLYKFYKKFPVSNE